MTATPSETHEAALSDERLRDQLITSGQALLDLDAKGVLVPHGIGGLAREIIEGFIDLARRTQPSAGEVVGGVTDDMLNAGQSRLCEIRSRTNFDDGAQAEIYLAMRNLDPAFATPPDQSRVERLEEALRVLADSELVTDAWVQTHARQALHGDRP